MVEGIEFQVGIRTILSIAKPTHHAPALRFQLQIKPFQKNILQIRLVLDYVSEQCYQLQSSQIDYI